MKTTHIYGHLETSIQIGQPAFIHTGKQVLQTSAVQHFVENESTVDIITKNTHYVLHRT